MKNNYSNILTYLSLNEFGQQAGITPLQGVLSLRLQVQKWRDITI